MSLADFFEAKVGPSLHSLAGGQLPVQQVFWDPPIQQVVHVAQTVKATLLEQVEEAGYLGVGQDLIVCNGQFT